MTGHARVRIPWTVRLNRFRRHVLPLLGFATCTVLTTWLWDRQGSLPNTVGEVEAVRIEVAAATMLKWAIITPLGFPVEPEV